MEKVSQLTPEQEAKLPKYATEGIHIGLATSDEPINERLVRELTDKHRELCGVDKATNFLMFDSPFAACKEISTLTPANALYGQHDIYWLQDYRFFQKECGVEGLDDINYLYELTELVGWMWMSDDTTVVTRRPTEIYLQQKPGIQVLHNYNDMALKYADGTGLYMLNGVRIPYEYAHLIKAYSDDIPVQEVMQIENTEIRTEFLKKIGIERAFEKLDRQKLDTDTLDIGGTYELFSVKFSDDLERKYLRGVCPSNAEPFFEAVHPDATTVQEAISFRNFGDIAIRFKAPLELT